ncbi:ferredoxin reductase [Pseudonocardia sp.]|uniref:ferredoxin reductase n=1 Tax=Pseudonocardia sp. TaxID=60912 RepID=UPI003D118468
MARATVRRRLTWQVADVTAVARESARCVRIGLVPPAWGGHVPGQHVDVRLTAEDGYTAQRSYSIASPPGTEGTEGTAGFELVVERLPDGEVSPYLADELRVGDQLELRGPIGGHFVWPHPGDPWAPLLLVAGGSGVVPMLAMLGHHRRTGSDVPVRLLYSVRADDDVLGRAELAPRPGLDVVLTYTRTPPAGWSGATGRIDAALLESHGLPPTVDPAVYVCGPTPFVEVVAQALVALGHDGSRIRTERFGGMGEAPTGGAP